MATHELNYKTETVTHLEKRLMDAKGERWSGERHKREVGISIDTVP